MLKAVGVAATSTTSVATTVAKGKSPDNDEIYESGLRILENTGEVYKFREYLENRGFITKNKHQNKVLNKSSGDEDGVSTQELQKTNIEGDITLSESCSDSSYVYANFTWEFDFTNTLQNAEKPNDVIGIHFPSNDYDRIVDTQYGSTNTKVPREGTPQYGDLDPSGVAFEWDDWEAQQDASEYGTGPKIGSFVGLKIKKNEPTPEERLVVADYRHTHRTYDFGGALKGVTISSGFLSVNLDYGGEKWQASWDASGNEEESC